jgi:hypothetical protein
MSDYSLDPGEYVYRLTCTCCGKEKNRVWGFVSKNNDAHAVYYALLNVEEKAPRLGLTLSVGPWWDGTEPLQRAWVHLNTWSDENGIQMNVRDPKESNLYPWEKGGEPLNREQAQVSTVIEEIWSVADFVVAEDVAISSYLRGNGVDPIGREVRSLGDAVNNCQ